MHGPVFFVESRPGRRRLEAVGERFVRADQPTVRRHLPFNGFHGQPGRRVNAGVGLRTGLKDSEEARRRER